MQTNEKQIQAEPSTVVKMDVFDAGFTNFC